MFLLFWYCFFGRHKSIEVISFVRPICFIFKMPSSKCLYNSQGSYRFISKLDGCCRKLLTTSQAGLIWNRKWHRSTHVIINSEPLSNPSASPLISSSMFQITFSRSNSKSLGPTAAFFYLHSHPLEAAEQSPLLDLWSVHGPKTFVLPKNKQTRAEPSRAESSRAEQRAEQTSSGELPSINFQLIAFS